MACRSMIVGLHEGQHVRAIVCGPRARRKRCACGNLADWQCDWIVQKATETKSGLPKRCDRHICNQCTTKPEPDKDLCPACAALWKAHSSYSGAKS